MREIPKKVLAKGIIDMFLLTKKTSTAKIHAELIKYLTTDDFLVKDEALDLINKLIASIYIETIHVLVDLGIVDTNTLIDKLKEHIKEGANDK